MSDAASTNNPAFVQAAQEANNLPTKPDNNELLKLYGLYKQSIVGDNNT
ncbi:5128_t:CDS:2, partial [Paraglomus occultum]